MPDRTDETQGEMEMWYPTIQGMIGQFYVLSYFYYVYVAIISSRTDYV